MSESYRHLFGPVRSRRLGRSLGLDLVPFKVCSFDCPYCQVGVTTNKTLVRAEYVPVTEVLEEFDRWMAVDGKADHLTLAGAGEPTLHLRFGEVLESLAVRSRITRVLLSNGSLFYLPEVRAAACKADIVKGTLAAWDSSSFAAVHRPHPSLDFATFFSGLKAMRAQFRGEYWLEVFLVAGINDEPGQVASLAALAREIGPDRIHLNTAVRPPQAGKVAAVSPGKLAELATLFSPVAEISVAAPAPAAEGAHLSAAPAVSADRLLALLQRHPCTAADMAVTTGGTSGEIEALLRQMVDGRQVREDWRDGVRFYVAL
jgi:wyosine [tRNA(Phe)-imidazoG37] synthetase (radical SAM superfamily)